MQYKYFYTKRRMSLFVFSCVVSVGTLLLYNIPFFSYVATNHNGGLAERLWLLASVAVVMLTVNLCVTYMLMLLLRMVGRIP